MPQTTRKECKYGSLKQNGLKNKDEALFSSLQQGSLTIEAAVLLPLFLFTMATVLLLFRVLQLQYMVGEALDKAVTEAALLREETQEEVENTVKLLFYKNLAVQDSQISWINLGMKGFSWENSGSDEDYINMKVSYQIKMPGWMLRDNLLTVTECSKSRRWTGLPGNEESGSREEWVYITPSGSVYHKSRECTHLRLSVQVAEAEMAARYRACQLCAEGETLPSLIYITEEGDCYHIKLSCSGLKRTVYMIPLSQAEGRSPCSRCGGI